jgi:hypothetical protein
MGSYILSNTLASYLTSSGATNLYVAKTALTTTLTSYLTSTAATSLYAPKADPIFTGSASVQSLNATNVLTIKNSPVPTSNQLAAQMALSGGGTVTWTGTHLKRSERVLVLPVERDELGIDGFYDINCPSNGTNITFYNPSNATTLIACTTDGIPLTGWSGLYYELPGTSALATSNPAFFRIVDIANSTWKPNGNWILIAVRNIDHGLKWMPGQLTIPNSVAKPATYNTATGVCSWIASTYAPRASPTFTGNVISDGVITGQSSNGIGGWNSYQILAAPIGPTSAAFVRCLRPSGGVECGYTWGTVGDTSTNRWSLLMNGSTNDLNFYTPSAGSCMTLSADDGRLTVNRPAIFNSTISIGSSPVATKPQYAARFYYGGGSFLYFTSWGANTLTSSNVTRTDPGTYKFVASVPLQTRSIILVTSQGGPRTYASARVESNTVWYIYTTNFLQSDDLDVGFITVP